MIVKNPYITRIIEDIKYYLNIYNYGEEIKLEGLSYILNYIENENYNSIKNQMIDLGGGSGLVAYRLRKRGLKTAITIVDKYVEQKFGFKHICSSIENFNNDTKYQIILCLLVLELVEDRIKVIKIIHKLLTLNGICFILIPNIKGCNVRIWRDRAKKSNHTLSQLFYNNQKLVSTQTIKEELSLFGMKVIDTYNFGFLPVYSTNPKKRFTKRCYLALNANLKNYIEPCYNLLVVKREN